jgi:competence protein ComEC
MEMPVVLAGIMGITPLIIAFRGRRVDSLINLLLSAFIILIISPFALFQASFQLSFMATLGVIVLSPFIKDLIKFLGETMSVTVATTLSAFIMVIPIIMASFKTLNLTGLISNIIVLELIPLAYFSSLISLIFPLSLKSVNLFYYISDVVLKFIINASYYFSKFDSLVFDIEIKGHFVLGLYLIVMTVLFERYYQSYKRNTKE